MKKMWLKGALVLTGVCVRAHKLGGQKKSHDTETGLPLGSDKYLLNDGSHPLNGSGEENEMQREQRMNGEEPDGNIKAGYDPLTDAYCFNDEYKPRKPYNLDAFYGHYKAIFDFGFDCPTDFSEENGHVTNDRFAGMMLRMCFHDNAVYPDVQTTDEQTTLSFHEYIENHLEDRDWDGFKETWTGYEEYMPTSGGDASVLVCSKERFHPNQNYDQTASRVLNAFQSSKFFQKRNMCPPKKNSDVADLGPKNIKSMKERYDLSYADLLHNGCIAATVYLGHVTLAEVKKNNEFTFGRKDACHRYPAGRRHFHRYGPSHGRSLHELKSLPRGKSTMHKRKSFPTKKSKKSKKSMMKSKKLSKQSKLWPWSPPKEPSKVYALCGPTELLPGVFQDIKEIRSWFKKRGMSDCNWLSLFWTHTTMDNMAHKCPLQNLPCHTNKEMYYEFVADPGKDRLYFCNPHEHSPQYLDYFDYFLTKGKHEVRFEDEDDPDPERPNCNWKLEKMDDIPCYNDINDDENDRWPLTTADCTIALDNAQLAFPNDTGMQDAMENFSSKVWNVEKALLCALRVLGGPGEKEGGFCDDFAYGECSAQPDHFFGSYFGDRDVKKKPYY